jgi:hypothetical protein
VRLTKDVFKWEKGVALEGISLAERGWVWLSGTRCGSMSVIGVAKWRWVWPSEGWMWPSEGWVWPSEG